MSTTPRGTVEETGAKTNDLLFGINRLNEDMLIQVLSDQEPVGKRVAGSFILVRAGVGVYAHWLKDHEGRVLEAKELIDLLRSKGGDAVKATHILNRNQLKLYGESKPDVPVARLIDTLQTDDGKSVSVKPAEPVRSNIVSEANLEAFLIANLNLLEPGLRLVKQQLDCREAGRLDLLCQAQNGDLLVVELKKHGVNHDFVVGQILRYIGYVRTHIAKPGQKVRGIIVVGRLDEKLRYAVSAIDCVEVKTFDITIQ